MTDAPELTAEEWGLIAELLECERKELHPEIRRTRTTGVRVELHERLRTVESILERLRQASLA